MLVQYLLTKLINLAKGHGLHPRRFKAKAKTTDAAKEVKDAHHSPNLVNGVLHRFGGWFGKIVFKARFPL
jgi:hypothetical protein